MTDEQRMIRIDQLLSHVWMVRTFLKHSEEGEEDDELQEIFRELYDYMMAVGAAFKAGDAERFLKMARKKWRRLRDATASFVEIQPEISSHTNFQMAAQSLQIAVDEIDQILNDPDKD